MAFPRKAGEELIQLNLNREEMCGRRSDYHYLEFLLMINLTSNIVEVEDSWEAANDWFCREKLSDGLPIVPPTPERVARMLGGTSRDPQEAIGPIPPKWAPGQHREDRHQRGYGRMPAGVPAGDYRRRGSDLRAAL
ncbi:MAG: hypothetical protein WD688_02740 [Candidatus Binatia bacterium]